MSKLLIQVFLAVLLYLSERTLASVDVPLDDRDLTKSILGDNTSTGGDFLTDDENDQTSVKSYSERKNSDIYGQTQAEQLNEQLSVLDVLLRKRRTESSKKSEDKELDIPHADKLPIKSDVHDYVTNNAPSIQDDTLDKESAEEKAHVQPITVKLASSTNRDDNTAKDKESNDDKIKGESVKIIVKPLALSTS